MIRKKNILLLKNKRDSEQGLRIETLLRVSRYEVSLRDLNAPESTMPFQQEELPSPIDLLIVVVGQAKEAQLKAVLAMETTEKILFVYEQNSCAELYCVKEQIGRLCHLSALLACVQEMLNAKKVTLPEATPSYGDPKCLVLIDN